MMEKLKNYLKKTITIMRILIRRVTQKMKDTEEQTSLLIKRIKKGMVQKMKYSMVRDKKVSEINKDLILYI